MSVEAGPQITTLAGDDVNMVFHSWGTTGIILDAHLKLVPAETWIDCIATFPSYGQAIGFGNAVFHSDVDVFLLSAVEKRFAPFYRRMQAYFDGRRDAMFSMVNARDVDRFFELARGFDGVRAMAVSADESASARLRPIHETAFNHTTLVALKTDPSWTYLQVVMPDPFEPALAEAQLRKFGDEVLMHHEFTKENGRPADRRFAADQIHQRSPPRRDHARVRGRWLHHQQSAHLQARRRRPLRPARDQAGIPKTGRSVRPHESG